MRRLMKTEDVEKVEGVETAEERKKVTRLFSDLSAKSPVGRFSLPTLSCESLIILVT